MSYINNCNIWVAQKSHTWTNTQKLGMAELQQCGTQKILGA